MSAIDLKNWMERNSKTTIDVASLTGLSLSTINRYLDGAGVNRSTQRLLDQLVRETVSAKRTAAVG